jgi:TIR domain
MAGFSAAGAKKVFISHSGHDKSFVDRLVSDLAKNGIPVWYDKLDLRIGESIPGKINDGLAGAKYFLIVLSPHSATSAWVREELNSALMMQVAAGGTFIIPVLLADCEIPRLLSHRRFADFRKDYDDALSELLSLWNTDHSVSAQMENKALYPWPDIETSDAEHVYLHSSRFDKFFRMNCSLSWTANHTIDYVVSTLHLPRNKELPELGMRWSFSYGLVYNDELITLSTTLQAAGVTTGNVLRINISGKYEDLYEKELSSMWDGSKMYEMSGALRRQAELQLRIRDRGPLTQMRLREVSNSCFKHV